MTTIVKQQASAIGIVKDSWGAKAPDWVMNLATFCDQNSQASVARKMKCSGALINQVLKNKYPGSLSNVEKRVKHALNGKVSCPVLGEIDSSVCLNEQKQPYRAWNPVVVRLSKECRSCPNNLNCQGGRT